MFNNSKFKTCFGMPLMNEIKFTTLGGSDAIIRFTYEYDHGATLFEPVINIIANTVVTINGDLELMRHVKSFGVTCDMKNPKSAIKELQTKIVTQIINEVFDEEVS